MPSELSDPHEQIRRFHERIQNRENEKACANVTTIPTDEFQPLHSSIKLKIDEFDRLRKKLADNKSNPNVKERLDELEHFIPNFNKMKNKKIEDFSDEELKSLLLTTDGEEKEKKTEILEEVIYRSFRNGQLSVYES